MFLGGKEVRARHFGRGHTNGDALILFPERRVLHTGDLFESGSLDAGDDRALLERTIAQFGSLVDLANTLNERERMTMPSSTHL